MLGDWVRGKRRWDPMHRLVGVIAEGHKIVPLIFSLEKGSRSKVDKEERKETWRRRRRNIGKERSRLKCRRISHSTKHLIEVFGY